MAAHVTVDLMCEVVVKYRVLDHSLKEKMHYVRFAERIKEIREFKEMGIRVMYSGTSEILGRANVSKFTAFVLCQFCRFKSPMI